MENNLQNESPNSEKVFYKDINVTVTQSRLIVGNQTYAMRNISSVSNYEISKSRLFPILAIIVGIIVLIVNSGGSIWGWICLIGGIGLLFLIKNDFAVRISSNAGEANTLTSKDTNYIQKVVNAINDAIIHRG